MALPSRAPAEWQIGSSLTALPRPSYTRKLLMNAALKPVIPAAVRCPSYYSATLNEETDYPILQGEVSVDVVIIGGFTGVASAVELA